MDTVRIIQEIDAQISRLKQVKAILTGTVTKPGSKATQTKRVMSAEGKAKIAAAQKARWANSKRADKKAAPAKTSPVKKGGKKSAKSVKATKPVKGTKPTNEDKPVAQS